MITELTAEQKAKMPEYVDKWVKIGLSTEPADRPKAEEIMDRIYAVAKFDPPKKIWVDSPFAAIDKLREMGITPDIDNFCFGANDAGWLSFYSFVKNELKIEGIEDIVPLLEFAEVCGWYYPMDELCILCERPSEIHIEDGKVHCENGPAILFRDGHSLYYLNGVKVSKELVETPWNKLDPSLILKETNAEIRREIVRKIGIERAIKGLNADVADAQGDYELLMAEISPGVRRPYLKMINPSIGTYHIEGVHPDCKTVSDALEWRNGTKKSPDVLT